MPDVAVETKDERQITIPNGGLTDEQTVSVATFIKAAAADGYILKSVAARQRDTGTQRDPNVVTTAVVLTFKRP